MYARPYLSVAIANENESPHAHLDAISGSSDFVATSSCTTGRSPVPSMLNDSRDTDAVCHNQLVEAPFSNTVLGTCYPTESGKVTNCFARPIIMRAQSAVGPMDDKALDASCSRKENC